MKINIFNEQNIKHIDIKKVEEITKKVLNNEIGDSDYEINILITDNNTIKKYNEEYRKKNGPTDVLSFEYGLDEETIGEIILSVKKIEEQAPKFGNSFEKEFFYILIHGILHICGYDHITENDKRKMFELQDKYFNDLF
ncbi:probable rRNA maturation factor [Marinitoga hydrogenitolerans DSM 16785]|uniref:Endoribonuclease YbeY n=1 Tax=Marinitoga hydrogenitolerans (strain DSM 16785 / JCM 12826 / AT1271) TaxID=1122195 RepID=A0A1M4U8L7_MARH1|nr:rRNA maturation RNase YbeY [Marinitoga hydrogenitolerans]SHE52903.1 probable rRNA maturation factor [Marinitoga hydrogenitolerans DSM 16785]